MESCEVVENENSIWVVRQLFGSLYISCLVEKSSLGRHTSHRSLVGVLRCVEDLSTLLAPKQMQEKVTRASVMGVACSYGWPGIVTRCCWLLFESIYIFMFL